MMMTRREEVGAPHHDQPAPGDLFGIEPDRMAFRRQHVARRAADAADLPARAKRVKEPHQGATLYDAHRPEVVQRQERLATVLGNDRREAMGDDVERGVPRDALEHPVAFRSSSAQRVQQAIRCVGALLIIVDLRAQHATRERVFARTFHANHALILDVGDPGARILAIVGTATFYKTSLGHTASSEGQLHVATG